MKIKQTAAIILSLLLCGCNSVSPALSDSTETASGTESVTTAPKSKTERVTETTADPLATGKVINIYTWDEELAKTILELYTPPEGFTINITTVEEKNYANGIERFMNKSDRQSPDERVDLFFSKLETVRKFVESDLALPLSEYGITADDTANMYPYTLSYGTDDNGELKALTWYITPDTFIYRRSYADEHLLSSDPAVMRQMIGTWNDLTLTANFFEVSADDGIHTYRLAASGAEFMRPLAQNAETPLVTDGVLTFPETWSLWVYLNVHLTNAGYFGVFTPHTKEWYAEMGKDGTTLGFVGSYDLLFKTISEYAGTSEDGTFGDWAVCPATLPSAAGGTFLSVASGSDNPEIAADIIKTVCVGEDNLRSMDIIPNNMNLVAEYAASTEYNAAILGGQNPYPIYDSVARVIPVTYLDEYGDLAEQFALFNVLERTQRNDPDDDFSNYAHRSHSGLVVPRRHQYIKFDIFDSSYYSFRDSLW
ncbi:MAG: extracellular solute-binding protein [Ruminococcus sp.]|jgi:hypothetical protein|nr:extracellular solute-binding protein [Ruminococcus sp.]